ncbi:MAG: hypothetical protein ACM3SS_16975 [Rhodospirillaceae bacterium]
MTIRRYINIGLLAVAFLGAVGGRLLYSSAGTESLPPGALATGYSPTPGFEYFPAQYKSHATTIEDHVENF